MRQSWRGMGVETDGHVLCPVCFHGENGCQKRTITTTWRRCLTYQLVPSPVLQRRGRRSEARTTKSASEGQGRHTWGAAFLPPAEDENIMNPSLRDLAMAWCMVLVSALRCLSPPASNLCWSVSLCWSGPPSRLSRCRLGLVSWLPPKRAQAPEAPSTPIQAPPPGRVMGASGQGAPRDRHPPAKLPVETCASKVRGFPPNFHRSTILTTISRRPSNFRAANTGPPLFSAFRSSPPYFPLCSAFVHFIFRGANDNLGATLATAFAVTADILELGASQHHPRTNRPR